MSVALDTGGADAVRPFVRPAKPIDVPPPLRAIMGWTEDEYRGAKAPTYPCLIDERHVVAAAYDMPNVPMAVWIDEDGRIVRPAEPAGATDGFRSLDRATMTLPEDLARAGRASRARYRDAIRDWVAHGAQSRYALSPQAVRARIETRCKYHRLADSALRRIDEELIVEPGAAGHPLGHPVRVEIGFSPNGNLPVHHPDIDIDSDRTH